MYRDLGKCLEERGVRYRILRPGRSTRTAREAAEALGTSLDRIIKSVIVVDERGRLHQCIVPGDKRIDTTKVARVLGVSRVRLASPEEVLRATGYRVGEVPPLCLEGVDRVVIDERVFRHERVYGGGGSVDTLVEIDPRDLLIERERVVVADISL